MRLGMRVDRACEPWSKPRMHPLLHVDMFCVDRGRISVYRLLRLCCAAAAVASPAYQSCNWRRGTCPDGGDRSSLSCRYPGRRRLRTPLRHPVLSLDVLSPAAGGSVLLSESPKKDRAESEEAASGAAAAQKAADGSQCAGRRAGCPRRREPSRRGRQCRGLVSSLAARDRTPCRCNVAGTW